MMQVSRPRLARVSAFVCRVLPGLGLFTQVCFAAPAPQVEAGLTDFQHARFAEAQAAWRQAARAGDPRGALYLGVMYDSGVGLPRDWQQAMQWYRQAAAQGSTVAAFNIGVLYDGGFGVAPDRFQAAAWYEKAASAGFGRAEYNLAMLYETGDGVPRDPRRALALYRSAAAHGIAAAGEHLALLREPAEPQPRSTALSRHAPVEPPVRSTAGFSREPPPVASDADPDADTPPPSDAATKEFQRAQRSVLTRGAANSTRTARLFRRAAEKHNALAEYDLAYCYEHGLGVPADPATAALWYHRAATDSADTSLRSLAQAGAGSLEAQPASASPPASPSPSPRAN